MYRGGKRPGGVTSFVWNRGSQRVWDYTPVSILADTYVGRTSENQGDTADFRQQQRRVRYRVLKPKYLFVPIGSGTVGHWRSNAYRFLMTWSPQLIESTMDERAASILVQRLSASCITDSCLLSEELEEVNISLKPILY